MNNDDRRVVVMQATNDEVFDLTWRGKPVVLDEKLAIKPTDILVIKEQGTGREAQGCLHILKDVRSGSSSRCFVAIFRWHLTAGTGA
jgi:hypothetical protein